MHVCTLQEENVVFLTQKVAAHEMCDVNFVIYPLRCTMCDCLLWHILH
jgi:hypothetical protein